jgi:hypothetical protein
MILLISIKERYSLPEAADLAIVFPLQMRVAFAAGALFFAACWDESARIGCPWRCGWF